MRARIEGLVQTVSSMVIFGRQPVTFFNETKGQKFLNQLAEQDKKLQAEAMKQSSFILWANSNDPGSLFHASHFPKELALHIAGNLYSVLNDNCFFASKALNLEPSEKAEEVHNSVGFMV